MNLSHGVNTILGSATTVDAATRFVVGTNARLASFAVNLLDNGNTVQCSNATEAFSVIDNEYTDLCQPTAE
ncbi:MAG: hypothetical protein GWP70_03035 [Proteobacteria bacterium]|nr:hypothetical protein [Pseudomonadota bacterium]